MEIKVLKNIMKRNEDSAAINREIFNKNGILAVNMMSSPGAGKTTILEETLPRLAGSVRTAVIEGDLMTSKDAERIHRHNVPVVQINTEGGCHLDANMVNRALDELDTANLDLVIIENVGNLVCPSSFDLGEHLRVVVTSVPEGDDKPVKYPVMFQEAKACILNKIDLIPYSNFNEESFLKDVTNINSNIKMFQLSAVNGEGLDSWCSWIKDELAWNSRQEK